MHAQNTISLLGSIVIKIRGDVHDHLVITTIFTLIISKIFIWAPKKMWKVVMALIRICYPSHIDCMLHYLRTWGRHLIWLTGPYATMVCLFGGLSWRQAIKWPIQSFFWNLVFFNTLKLLWKAGWVIFFCVGCVYDKSKDGFVARVLCPKIVLHTWPFLVDCSIEAKLWLISKTISRGKANYSLQCDCSASKQFWIFTLPNIHTQNIYALKNIENSYYC